MCGIAGVLRASVHAQGELEPVVRRCLGALSHRGPDDSGHVLVDDGRVALGNTRLAIQDLSRAGRQPMSDGAGRSIVMNGEIYNHWDVRRELDLPPEEWRSRSDTETVLRAYGRWGPACLTRLKGMFALAIWDAERGELLLARDRLGIKPLYLYRADDMLVFASEVRALLASGLVPRRLDRAGLAGFVRFGALPEPLTLIEGVASLPAGHHGLVRPPGRLALTRYWNPEAALQDPVRPDQDRPPLRGLLERAVSEHLLSDVPVATFLSGGVDSMVVTALASRAARVTAFTVSFDGPTGEVTDEWEAAATGARRWGVDHERVRIGALAAKDDVPRAVAAMDQPSADGINTFVISKAVAARGFKVALTGLGGDELFGGYPTFRALRMLSCAGGLTRLVPSWAVRVAARGGERGERATELRGGEFEDQYETLRSFWSRAALRALGLPAARLERPSVVGQSSEVRTSLLELGGYMKSTLLRDADCQSMSQSLELRVPFLDHVLVEHCLSTGAATRRRGRPPKALLIDACADLLPARAGSGPKRGFELPMSTWLRGSLRAFAAEGLSLAHVRALPLLEPSGVLDAFDRGRLGWSRVWQLVALGHWLKAHGVEAER